MGLRRMGWHELLWIGRVLVLMLLVHGVFGWGKEGHYAVCKIAEGYLTEDALATVKELLPDSAKGELASVCSWPDDIKWYYKWHWSSPLHYVDTPDFKCNYNYQRDCHDLAGHNNSCVTGAIFNYTRQLFSAYQDYKPKLKYNLTEALMFLAHFMGDVHQPLHVGFTGDLGGNTITVRWYRRKTNLHHVWDTMIIDSAVKTFYGSDLAIMIQAIQRNITDAWSNDIPSWEYCGHNHTVCPNLYASESVRLACKFAYKNATPGSTLEGDQSENLLERDGRITVALCINWPKRDRITDLFTMLYNRSDDYFLSRLPIVEKRLAQGGIRLAAVLNRIFTSKVKIARA